MHVLLSVSYCLQWMRDVEDGPFIDCIHGAFSDFGMYSEETVDTFPDLAQTFMLGLVSGTVSFAVQM